MSRRRNNAAAITLFRGELNSKFVWKFGFVLVLLLCFVYYLSHLWAQQKLRIRETMFQYIKPPPIEEKDKLTLIKLKQHIFRHEIVLAEQQLSALIQSQIASIQGRSCDQPNLQCGQQHYCGLGCQIHHRVGCLLMSYATNLPLIDTAGCEKWSYSDPWTDAFAALGSTCSPGQNTTVWKWKDEMPFLSDCHESKDSGLELGKSFPYPLFEGIPVDSELGWMIEKISPNPFLWMVGQFTKYVMKLNSTMETKLEKCKTDIGFENDPSSPIVGIHVRLTDKITGGEGQRHDITEYMNKAEEYFRRRELSQKLHQNSIPRTVFVASEKNSILDDAIKMYPKWKVIGFKSPYSESTAQRAHGLFEIVRDIHFLSRCDFVVCTLSSNICRLVYEMQSYLYFDDSLRLVSVEGNYKMPLWGHDIKGENMRILKISRQK